MGEHHRNAANDGIVAEVHLLIDGHEAGLPVMRVQDGRPHTPIAHVFERGAAEERESARVVGIIARGRSVEAFAIEQLRDVDEGRPDVLLNCAFVDPERLFARAEIDAQILPGASPTAMPR